MKRILIAGNCDNSRVKMTHSYLRAVRGVHAVPALSFAESEADAAALAEMFDALILPGGGDLPGALFGQPAHISCHYDDPMRDQSDRLLLTAFRDQRKRVLGICRGCQAVNVFLGGTLHQHLPDAFNPVLWHSDNITGRHPARVEPGTVLSSLLGSGEVAVNSSHHQAIDRLGEGLRIAAKAPDGVIEAAEGENLLLLQWHPERMDEPGMRAVFEWVIG